LQCENKKTIKTDKNMGAIHLTKGDFENRIANIEEMAKEWRFLGDKPALIDFYASWCGPCQRLSPIIDELAEEYAGKVDIYKVNVDDEETLSQLFRIRSIPTLVYIPMNDRPTIEMGGKTKVELKKRIEENLLK
jgi:thioredoxin